MAKSSTRQTAQKKLDSAIFHIDACGQYLNQVHEVYEKYHPEVSEPLMVVMKLLVEAQAVVQKVRRSF